MPRLPEFDRDEVLDSALQVFWSEGYEASSINKLLDAMGINRGSLYGAFTDKASLFREVTAVYARGVGELVEKTLVDISDPVEALQQFFYQAFLDADELTTSRGCLLFNTISELNHNFPEMAQEASSYMKGAREVILRRLTEAQENGQLSSEKNPDTQADYLLAMIAGLRILCKMGSGKDEIKSVIDTTLGALWQ